VWVSWISRHRVGSAPFERYVQELTAHRFLATLPPPVRTRILFLARMAPFLFERAVHLEQRGIPDAFWGKRILSLD